MAVACAVVTCPRRIFLLDEIIVVLGDVGSKPNLGNWRLILAELASHRWNLDRVAVASLLRLHVTHRAHKLAALRHTRNSSGWYLGNTSWKETFLRNHPTHCAVAYRAWDYWLLSKRAPVGARASHGNIGRNLKRSLRVLFNAIGVLEPPLNDCLSADDHLWVTCVGIRVKQICELLVRVYHGRARLEPTEVIYLLVWIEAKRLHCNFSGIFTAAQLVLQIRVQRLPKFIFLYILISPILISLLDLFFFELWRKEELLRILPLAGPRTCHRLELAITRLPGSFLLAHRAPPWRSAGETVTPFLSLEPKLRQVCLLVRWLSDRSHLLGFLVLSVLDCYEVRWALSLAFHHLLSFFH